MEKSKLEARIAALEREQAEKTLVENLRILVSAPTVSVQFGNKKQINVASQFPLHLVQESVQTEILPHYTKLLTVTTAENGQKMIGEESLDAHVQKMCARIVQHITEKVEKIVPVAKVKQHLDSNSINDSSPSSSTTTSGVGDGSAASSSSSGTSRKTGGMGMAEATSERWSRATNLTAFTPSKNCASLPSHQNQRGGGVFSPAKTTPGFYQHSASSKQHLQSASSSRKSRTTPPPPLSRLEL